MAKAAALKKMDMKQAHKKTSAKTQAKSVPENKKTQLKMVKVAVKPAPSKAKKPATAAKKPVAMKMVQKAAPAKTPVKAPVKQQAKAAPAAKPQALAPKLVKQEPAKAPAKRSEFRIGDHVVYPTHGVGRIVLEETQNIGDVSLRMLVIAFDKDRMTLRVPVSRAAAAGLRHVSGGEQMLKVFVTLKSRAKASRGMWSRRAQEYETKINSGNILFIAEVVRDLHPNVDQAERSYSERMIYESALSRLVGELAAAEGTDQKIANDKLMKLLRAKHAA